MRDIFKLIAINLREDRQDDYFDIEPHLNDFYKKSTLSEEELTYFINHGNNVTIFIHGYNVPYGNFGRTIQTKEKEKLKNSIFSMQDIYRDNHMLINEFPDANIEGKKLDPLRTILTNIIAYDSIKKTRFRRHPQDIDTVLNGKGAHNWWLHMEWNLNHATSQFDDTDFSEYTRLLHVSWKGNPILSLDYMAAVPMADHAAYTLLPVIEQLIKKGIEINIIAHSLGCRVLLKLMDILGQKAQNHIQYQECLNHIFLWEPAIADNAFSNTPYSPFPQAHRAAKKITVFYSEQDNVLGPVPSKIYNNFWEKAFDPNSGFMLALCAGAIHLIDKRLHTQIHSPYNLANTLVYPLTAFLNDGNLRQQFYQEWIENHEEIDGHATKPFLPTLAEQMNYTKINYTKSYNFLNSLLQKAPKEYRKALHDAAKWWFGKSMDSASKHFFLLKPFNFIATCFAKMHKTPKDVSVNELATLIIMVLTSKGPFPVPAMGYSGPDIEQDEMTRELYQKGKLTLVPQHDWLTEHSSMKNPSSTLMKHIYKLKIWHDNPDYHFGKYKH